MEIIFVIDSYKIKFFGNLILSLTSISARLSKNIIAFTPLRRQLVIYKEDISPINTFQSFDHSILENFYRNYFCDWFLSKEICRISQFQDTIKISSVRISSMKVLHTLFIPVKIHLTTSWSLKCTSLMDPFTSVSLKNSFNIQI